jgi:hypothetical protein
MEGEVKHKSFPRPGIDVIAGRATEHGLREPRAGAVAIDTPTGFLGLMGGVHPDRNGATGVELLDSVQAQRGARHQGGSGALNVKSLSFTGSFFTGSSAPPML